MIDEKNLIERLQRCVDTSDNSNFTNGLLSTIDIVNQQPKIGEWIPCSERLPEEPEELPTEDKFIKRMILDREFEEYIVTIYGAKKATTLYYIGNGDWYDEISSECYKVIAWRPFPEVYKE